jgi:hypothetical protein
MVGSCSLAMALRRFGMRLAVIPHLLLPLRQSSLRGTAMVVMNSMGHAMYPATRTAAAVCSSFIRKIRYYGKPHPFALHDKESLCIGRGFVITPHRGAFLDQTSGRVVWNASPRQKQGGIFDKSQLSEKSTKAVIAIRVADCAATQYWFQRLFHAAVRSEDCFCIRSRCGH